MNVALVQIENSSNLFSVLAFRETKRERTEERNKRPIILLLSLLCCLNVACRYVVILSSGSKNLSNSKQQTMKHIHRKFSVSTQIFENEYLYMIRIRA